MVEVFNDAEVEKLFFLLTSNVQTFFFVSKSIKSVKERISQKKNGGHQASKRVISIIKHRIRHQLPVLEHCLSCDMFDILMFLMILCASTKKNYAF